MMRRNSPRQSTTQSQRPPITPGKAAVSLFSCCVTTHYFNSGRTKVKRVEKRICGAGGVEKQLIKQRRKLKTNPGV
jgi:hypothetical protein